MAATQKRNNVEAVRTMTELLETRPKNEGLADFGVIFTDPPLRDIGSMAWLLTMERYEDRTDRFLVIEDADTHSPGCGHNPQLSASVSRLVVDLRYGVMRMAHERWTTYHRNTSLLHAAEELTAHSFLRSYARTPQLLALGMGDAPREYIQTQVEARLYHVSEGLPSPLDANPVPIEAESFGQDLSMKRMVQLISFMQRHSDGVAPTSG